MLIKCYKLPDYNWHSQCNEWSGLGLFTLSFTGIYSIPTLYKWVCQEPNCFTVDSNHITVFFLNKLIKDMIDISRYWRWRYQTDFHCYFFFLRHFSNVNVKSIVKTIKFKFNRWWKPPYFITCGDEIFLLSPSCKVFGAIFFADYFGTDLLVIIFFNSDTNIDYFFILIQTSIFKACVLSKAVREFVSYLPHTAAGHNTPIPCT